ncbi:hypothetical protein O0I10_005970 [Lichtheimia ornata]|uniref:Uncharacterized protein n=1 Tax=Lichtheimia ornata TaxID=688661 RepID=A0AAD7V3A7_9FUNG|nr:uncharacterized protein O0I10_005970 [Lichtheimia ornata]KAJ8658287.1 hypothetical protein O0I10_005970 [Lichtheimia ornata]
MDSEERTAVLWFMQGSCMVSFYSYTEGEGNRKRNLGTENLVLADLSYRQICSLKIAQPAIQHLTHLTKLELQSNRLTTLPAELWRLSGLEELNVGKNRITFIPPDIARLSQLRELYLYDNLIETLPSQVGDLKQLQILDVTANKLSYLPAELLRLALTNTWIDRNDFAVDLKWKQKEGPFRIRGASFSKTMRVDVLSLRSLCLQIAGSNLIELSQKEGNQELQHQLEILQHQSCLSQLLLDELLQPLSPAASQSPLYV